MNTTSIYKMVVSLACYVELLEAWAHWVPIYQSSKGFHIRSTITGSASCVPFRAFEGPQMFQDMKLFVDMQEFKNWWLPSGNYSNISHLGKRKIIFKHLGWGYVSSQQGKNLFRFPASKKSWISMTPVIGCGLWRFRLGLLIQSMVHECFRLVVEPPWKGGSLLEDMSLGTRHKHFHLTSLVCGIYQPQILRTTPTPQL